MQDHIESDTAQKNRNNSERNITPKTNVKSVVKKVEKSLSKATRTVAKTGKLLSKSVGKSVEKSVKESVSKAGKTVRKSINKATNKTVNEAVNSSANKPRKAPVFKLKTKEKPTETATVTQESIFKQYIGWRSLTNPLWCLYGMRISVVILSIFGLFMVFSSSSVTMITYGVAPWGQGINQTVYCILGMVGYIFASRVPIAYYRRYIAVIYMIAVVAQFLTFVPGLRREVNGNAGWIAFGPITVQPAEITKLALCIWLPIALLAAKQAYERVQMRAYIPVAVGLGVSLLLVIAGKDLGTALIIILIALIAFYLGGFPTRWLIGSMLVAIAMVALLVFTSQNRMRRILATLHGCDAKAARGVCFQAIHAQYAMASGGLLGVGIGNSREKWNYLPYAHNDFIFAIIGEEMGFLVASAVILLYVIIGWCIFSSALQTKSKFISITLMCISTWIVGQGLVNILVVVQILPVMGVPMPFVSAGGSSLVMCLIAVGVADGLMRANPKLTVAK